MQDEREKLSWKSECNKKAAQNMGSFSCDVLICYDNQVYLSSKRDFPIS